MIGAGTEVTGLEVGVAADVVVEVRDVVGVVLVGVVGAAGVDDAAEVVGLVFEVEDGTGCVVVAGAGADVVVVDVVVVDVVVLVVVAEVCFVVVVVDGTGSVVVGAAGPDVVDVTVTVVVVPGAESSLLLPSAPLVTPK